jgi:hypothetical protein
MKKILLMLFVATTTASFCQTKEAKSEECVIPAGYKEPKFKSGLVYTMTNSTVAHLKKHVAVENDCNVEDVIVLSLSEQKGNAMYSLCVKGKKMTYKRIGSVFMKNDVNPMDLMKGK